MCRLEDRPLIFTTLPTLAFANCSGLALAVNRWWGHTRGLQRAVVSITNEFKQPAHKICALLANISEQPGDQTLRLLIGEHCMRTIALDHGSGTIAAPRKAIPRLRLTQVSDLKAVVKLACEGRENGVVRLKTLLVGKHPRIRLPHSSQPVFVNVIYKALMRWFEHLK